MKVGILVECGRMGLEDVLCGRICALLEAERNMQLEVDIVPMVNKALLIQDCGTTAQRLLDDGCDRVVILWDERPAWPKKGEPLCWHIEREKVLAELRKAGLTQRPVFLVCIEREFESWLLFDGRVISCVLSTSAHRIRAKPPRRPDRIKNPKGAMNSLFEKHRGWRYVDVQYARAFANCLDDLSRMRDCETFRRFEAKVTGRQD
jgi:hypothetical protein